MVPQRCRDPARSRPAALVAGHAGVLVHGVSVAQPEKHRLTRMG